MREKWPRFERIALTLALAAALVLGTGCEQLMEKNKEDDYNYSYPYYSITFDANYDTGGTFTRYDCPVGGEYRLPPNNFTRYKYNGGYNFIGWNTAPDGSGTSYADEALVKDLASPGSTITLYAQWEEYENPYYGYYLIIFDGNGGKTSGYWPSTTSRQIYYGGIPNQLDQNQFKIDGYAFTGWNTEADGSGTSYADEETIEWEVPNEDISITLYAQWEPRSDIRYYVHHYQQNIENDYYSRYETETLYGTLGDMTAATVKNYPGFEIPDVTQTEITPDGTYILIEYKRKIYTANIELNGGSTQTNLQDGTVSGKYGAEFPKTGEIWREGNYVFAGWSPAFPATFGDADCWPDADNTITPTFTAIWTSSSGSVSVTVPEFDDISLVWSRNGATVTLTADAGYTDYSWRLDGTKLSDETSSTLTLDTTSWKKGKYEVAVEAQKDGNWYSATVYITIGGN